MAPLSFRWMVVRLLAIVDEALDQLLYRPAVVRLFSWLPRWWLCDVARVSMALDDRRRLGYWAAAGIAPGGVCEACGRRAAIHVVGRSDGVRRLYLGTQGGSSTTTRCTSAAGVRSVHRSGTKRTSTLR